jgi:hypothetical protein
MQALDAQSQERLRIRAEDRQLAARVLRFVDELEDDSEYAHALRQLAAQTWITRQGAGQLGSAFALYARAQRPENAEQRIDEHVGQIGQRLRLALKAVRVLELHDSLQRSFWLVVMRDSMGRAFRFTRPRPDIDVGAWYDIRATVREHDVSERFGHVTVLTNPRAIREIMPEE